MATDSTQQSSAPISTDQYVDSVDFRTRAVQLIACDGSTRDITNLTLEIQVRQDMFLGFMSGEMLVTDGIDMHSSAALHGNEYIFLHLQEPNQDISIKKAFRIYKVGSRFPIPSGGQRYMIYFASPEMFESSQKLISKAYPSTTVADIAVDIIKNHLKVEDARITVDATTDAFDYVLPSLRPAEALNWLASRAYNEEGSCYFFYENLSGFNFRSLHSLYKEPSPVKVPFVFENKTGMKQLDMDKYTIDDMQADKDFDSLSTLIAGGAAIALVGVDPIKRTHETFRIGQDTVKTLFPNSSMTNPDNLFSKTGSYTECYLFDKSTRSDNYIKRTMSMALLNNTQLELTVPGNIRLEVGKLISLRIPYATTPSESSDQWDRRKSGKYLIGAVNHKFDMSNHRFNTMLLLVRDSCSTALPVPDNQLPDKIRKLNSAANRE